MNVIQLHTTRAAKFKGVRIAAYIAAQRLGLTPNQCESVARKAGEKYRNGSSPAKSVADARVEGRELAMGNVA